VLDELRTLETAGVKLILCQTCLKYFKLTDEVEVGIVGGMGDIIEGMNRAVKVISL
jgi:peroxiredoxin family protein